MPSPDKAEIEHVVSKIAEQALEHAAGNAELVARFAQDWFPGYDFIDRREIARELARGLLRTAGLLDNRRLRLERQGRARCPSGQTFRG
jgi:hypothetical protein